MPGLVAQLIARPKDPQHQFQRKVTGYKVLAVLALIALTIQSGLLFLALFGRPLPYEITRLGPEPIGSPEFARLLASATFAGVYPGNKVTVFTNGESFYPAQIAAIRAAKKYVHIECYIFQQGRVTDETLKALEERARAGVAVRIVIDAIGSAGFPENGFERLEQAGGRFAWYHPLRWYTWPRVNNRIHRELIVIDGETAFAGGAGFADHWLYSEDGEPRWRDTMVRFDGGAATGLAMSFAENWLESTGEVLIASDIFPFAKGGGDSTALVVTSSPTTGRSTEARVLFQTLVAKAAKSIKITTPYFLPDESLRRELARAVRERGVDVSIITPGERTDHMLTRLSSRSLYGELLEAGAKIYEYQPAMNHTKSMVVDGVWAVIGSTNLDSRSFGLNDEVNVGVPDPEVARRLEADFETDLRRSRPISYEEWKERPWWERPGEWFGWLLINQS